MTLCLGVAVVAAAGPAFGATGPDCLHEALPQSDRSAALRSIERGGRGLPQSLAGAIRQCGAANGWNDDARLEATLLLGLQLRSDAAYRRTISAGATPQQLATIRQRLADANFEVTLEGLEGDGDGTPLFQAIEGAGLDLGARTTEPLLEWLVMAHEIRLKTATFVALP